MFTSGSYIIKSATKLAHSFAFLIKGEWRNAVGRIVVQTNFYMKTTKRVSEK